MPSLYDVEVSLIAAASGPIVTVKISNDIIENDNAAIFDDYFPCSKENCRLKHVQNWLTLFLSMHNKGVINA
ncbi:MAG: hypothetical protein WBP64_17175 [Nitrososphaeraceae archaeon]